MFRMPEARNKMEPVAKIIKIILIAFSVAAITPLSSYSQSAVHPNLKQEGLEKYEEESRREKLFVHTDKTFYLAGEHLWFKVYSVDGDNKRSDNLSKVAYLEVLDKDNEAVLQAKVALKRGSGHGSWFLPVSLNSGNYRLRGYTNWMKNFSPEFYFEKDITIVNSVVPAEPAESGVAKEMENPMIQFFPEGGNLLSGIENKVAFRIVGKNGKGVSKRGVLVNQEGDTITFFQPLKFGIGSFFFTPEPNSFYKAFFRNSSGEVMQQELPRVQSSGYGLLLEEIGDGKVKVRVQTPSNISQESVYLVLHSQQKVKIAKKASLRSGRVDILLDKEEMGDGVNQITLFNSVKSPVSERLYFKQPARQKLMLELKADQRQYACRQKVNLHLLAKDQEAKPAPAELSVAVYKVDSLQQCDPSDIYSYLWLSSDLKGEVESPAWYFTEEGAVVEEAMDNLMLTHGWRRFSLITEDEKQESSTSFKFLPEYEGHLITAQVVEDGSGSAASGVMVYLSVPGKKYHLYGARSKPDGSVVFNARNYFGEGEIVVQTNSKASNKYKVKINSPFSKEFSKSSPPEFRLSDQYKNQLLDYSVAMQVRNVYSRDEKGKKVTGEEGFNPYYGSGYDESYLLDDYTRFPTMEEVIREYVKGVRLKRQEGQLNLRVVNQQNELSFENNPLMLLNGVPVFDSQKVLSLDPYKIEEVGVVTNTYFNGALVSEGVVSLSTYTGDLAEISLDPDALVLDYEGLQFAREFYAPSYGSTQQQASRLPDFRNVLLWMPVAKTGEDGAVELSFYTSDMAGTYVVVVQGVTPSGKAGSASVLFKTGGAL